MLFVEITERLRKSENLIQKHVNNFISKFFSKKENEDNTGSNEEDLDKEELAGAIKNSLKIASEKEKADDQVVPNDSGIEEEKANDDKNLFTSSGSGSKNPLYYYH
ncbi:hypothetical protein DICPUDRAFT_155522 [Dictyostelium purpureum]|uniref:Uncharacterized protein n=1 Tax=Dictyostelium purpureum TaxID=5786 RepID=F0ZU81_DICPU|nr:uncharacterized protein DICPUDRAFT_155522 [Dictyostelium purpureum]EGC32494.1 hypothetical protein DICPUDRAFT_155522 [Dictyostelium purpureum]|eukprot:XP_003290987.1 hypothetical protein DICPUDRAFT_155522 [Dictyostelium purpureum]